MTSPPGGLEQVTLKILMPSVLGTVLPQLKLIGECVAMCGFTQNC